MWGHLFGVGLVDPVDDFSDSNPPSHPELLDALARELIAHEYDLKFLIRAIAASRTYQLSSRKTHHSQQRRQLFARILPQALTPEQLLASLSVAVGGTPPLRRRNLARTASSAALVPVTRKEASGTLSQANRPQFSAVYRWT